MTFCFCISFLFVWSDCMVLSNIKLIKKYRFLLCNIETSHFFYVDDAIFLGPATLDNLINMIATLKYFRQSSGLEINVLKPCLIFSKALHHRLCGILSHFVHIPASTSFCKYLGVLLVTHIPKVADYKCLLLNVNKRLAEWHTKFIILRVERSS